MHFCGIIQIFNAKQQDFLFDILGWNIQSAENNYI